MFNSPAVVQFDSVWEYKLYSYFSNLYVAPPKYQILRKIRNLKFFVDLKAKLATLDKGFYGELQGVPPALLDFLSSH